MSFWLPFIYYFSFSPVHPFLLASSSFSNVSSSLIFLMLHLCPLRFLSWLFYLSSFPSFSSAFICILHFFPIFPCPFISKSLLCNLFLYPSLSFVVSIAAMRFTYLALGYARYLSIVKHGTELYEIGRIRVKSFDYDEKLIIINVLWYLMSSFTNDRHESSFRTLTDSPSQLCSSSFPYLS